MRAQKSVKTLKKTLSQHYGRRVCVPKPSEKRRPTAAALGGTSFFAPKNPVSAELK
jgi:hypothetical protein